jgi:hypothetical protein
MAGFFLTLRHVGRQPGVTTGPGSMLNHGYRQATAVALTRPDPQRGIYWGHPDLPVSDPDDVTASYRNGILSVSIGLKTAEADGGPRRVPVKVAV